MKKRQIQAMLHALAKEGYHLTRAPIILKDTNQQRTSQGVQKEAAKRPRIPLKKLISVFLALCTIAGVAIIFVPRPQVSFPSVPSDPNNALSVSIDISNGSFIPLRDVSVYLAVGQIVGRDVQLDPKLIPTFEGRVTTPAWQHHSLGMDDRFTITPGTLVGGDKADIAIVISYYPWLLPLKRERLFRFITNKRRDGSTFWRAWPLGEPLTQFY